jgi:Domain of unknown function (DUF4397)
MRAVPFLIVGLAGAAGFGSAACGNGDDSQPPPAVGAPDAGHDASKGLDATTRADGADDTRDAAHDVGTAADGGTLPPTLASLRMANWSADAPAIDYCLAPHGTGVFQGPQLAARAAAFDDAGAASAGSGALAFPQVTAYLLVAPGQYDARVVAAGASDCSVAIVPQDVTDLPALAGGEFATIALMGATHPQHGEPALRIVGLRDELHGSLPDALIVRVINAAVDIPSVDVGTFDGMYLTPFFTYPVGFGVASVGPAADPNGYIPTLPVMDLSIAARAASATLVDAGRLTMLAQSPPTVVLPNGLSVTFVVVGGNGMVVDGGVPLSQILECVDNSGTAGLQGACRIISQ